MSSTSDRRSAPPGPREARRSASAVKPVTSVHNTAPDSDSSAGAIATGDRPASRR